MEHKPSHFFAFLARMKTISRWSLMRNTQSENIAEHSLQVAMLAHALCTIHNRQTGDSLPADRAAVLALYHDAGETLTGDLPTPVKYYNPYIKEAYKEIEKESAKRLLSMLPVELQNDYESLLFEVEDDAPLRPFVKAADKLSAYCKCLEEVASGNAEFRVAAETTREACVKMKMPEVDFFLSHFASSFSKTLDEMDY